MKLEAARFGLQLNAAKSRYLLAGDSVQLGSNLVVDGDILERSSAIMVVTSDKDMHREIREDALRRRSRVYYGPHHVMRSRPHEM